MAISRFRGSSRAGCAATFVQVFVNSRQKKYRPFRSSASTANAVRRREDQSRCQYSYVVQEFVNTFRGPINSEMFYVMSDWRDRPAAPYVEASGRSRGAEHLVMPFSIIRRLLGSFVRFLLVLGGS